MALRSDGSRRSPCGTDTPSWAGASPRSGRRPGPTIFVCRSVPLSPPSRDPDVAFSSRIDSSRPRSSSSCNGRSAAREHQLVARMKVFVFSQSPRDEFFRIHHSSIPPNAPALATTTPTRLPFLCAPEEAVCRVPARACPFNVFQAAVSLQGHTWPAKVTLTAYQTKILTRGR